MKPQESYDRVAGEYAERIAGELAHKPFDREKLERFARRAREVSGGEELPVLDLGCGPGHVTRYLHDLGLPVIGVDVSPRMLEEARRLNPGVAFQESDMRRLGWADASVAAIAAPYSILHIPREEVVDVLRELRRALVRGGWLYLSFHIGSEVRHLDDWWETPVDLDFVFFETAEMEGYLRAAGFTEIETHERDPYPEVEVQTRRAYVFARVVPVKPVTLPVILIGPVNAGKSTIAALLAERLGVDHTSLDEVCWDYYEQAGYDETLARQHFERGGQAGAREYMVRFYPEAVQRVVADYPRSVIALGAGHTVYDDPDQLARVKEALSPYPNVVLLLPSPDPDESIRVLKARQSNPHPEIVQMNEHFVRHGSNRELATITCYTKDKTPEETCEEVLFCLT